MARRSKRLKKKLEKRNQETLTEYYANIEKIKTHWKKHQTFNKKTIPKMLKKDVWNIIYNTQDYYKPSNAIRKKVKKYAKNLNSAYEKQNIINYLTHMKQTTEYRELQEYIPMAKKFLEAYSERQFVGNLYAARKIMEWAVKQDIGLLGYAITNVNETEIDPFNYQEYGYSDEYSEEVLHETKWEELIERIEYHMKEYLKERKKRIATGGEQLYFDI